MRTISGKNLYRAAQKSWSSDDAPLDDVFQNPDHQSSDRGSLSSEHASASGSFFTGFAAVRFEFSVSVGVGERGDFLAPPHFPAVPGGDGRGFSALFSS